MVVIFLSCQFILSKTKKSRKSFDKVWSIRYIKEKFESRFLDHGPVDVHTKVHLGLSYLYYSRL